MMTPNERELHINRIVAGCIKCELHDRKGKPITLLLKTPTRYHRYLAEEVYQESLKDGQLHGLKSNDEVMYMMIEEGLWDMDRQTKLDTLPKDLDELKVKMFELTFKSDEKRIVRNLCQRVKDDIAALSEQRNQFAYLSAEGAAHLAKVRYLIGMSLYTFRDKPFFNEATYWESSGHIVDEAIDVYNRHKLLDTDYRYLARTDPWRTIWSTKKSDGLFNIPAVDLSEEQKSLVVWSNIYESIHGHPECPPESVIEDDDLLDGWMIIQKRKRKDNMEKNKADEVVKNEAIKGMPEIYIPAQTKADASEVENLNDYAAKMTKKQRMAHLQKHGTVNEVYMPDTKLEWQTQVNNMYKERGKNV